MQQRPMTIPVQVEGTKKTRGGQKELELKQLEKDFKGSLPDLKRAEWQNQISIPNPKLLG